MHGATLAVLLVAVVAQSSCRPANSSATAAASQPVSVAVARVTQAREPRFQPVAGTVRPWDHAVICARVSGMVVRSNFAIGQQVAAGEVLLELQADELVSRSEQARAALDQAERDASRESGLVSQGASPSEAARTAADRLRVARGAYEEAKTLQSYTKVAAPFRGIIVRKLANKGDYAGPGTPLFELEGERMRTDLAVPENLPVLPVGETVSVEGNPHSFSAHVAETSPALDPATRTRHVILDFPRGAAVRSGQFVRARWPEGVSDIIQVPASALRIIGQIESVFVIADGKAVLRIIKTGTQDGPQVQILAGLEAGEQIIISPPPGLRDGQPVVAAP